MPDDFWPPFSLAPLPLPTRPQVGAGPFGLPYMPPLPPRYQGEWRNPAPRPEDPFVTPVAAGVGPLLPQGRAATAAGGLAAALPALVALRPTTLRTAARRRKVFSRARFSVPAWGRWGAGLTACSGRRRPAGRRRRIRGWEMCKP
jgi:hypothetical protein